MASFHADVGAISVARPIVSALSAVIVEASNRSSRAASGPTSLVSRPVPRPM